MGREEPVVQPAPRKDCETVLGGRLCSREEGKNAVMNAHTHQPQRFRQAFDNLRRALEELESAMVCSRSRRYARSWEWVRVGSTASQGAGRFSA